MMSSDLLLGLGTCEPTLAVGYEENSYIPGDPGPVSVLSPSNFLFSPSMDIWVWLCQSLSPFSTIPSIPVFSVPQLGGFIIAGGFGPASLCQSFFKCSPLQQFSSILYNNLLRSCLILYLNPPLAQQRHSVVVVPIGLMLLIVGRWMSLSSLHEATERLRSQRQ